MWEAQASANLALIKYMGKTPDSEFLKKNQALNPSLSYTLDHFQTKVRLEESQQDAWTAFKKETGFQIELSQKEQDKFLQFFKFLKKKFSVLGNYKIYSGNNFPISAGAASSSSAFAALSLAVFEVLKSQQSSVSYSDIIQASRLGSGSSCRSFFSPWALWDSSEVKPVDLPYKKLLHHLVVVDSSKKSLSSSKAHSLVKTSSFFKDRPRRARTRLQQLLQALNARDWQASFHIVFEEFLDMHQLFETCEQAFTYKTKTSKEVLDFFKNYWKKHKDGPLVTMDAGPNIHLLYRQDQKALADQLKNQLSPLNVLSS